jgi:DNA-binding CsgD family transcriptional regulator
MPSRNGRQRGDSVKADWKRPASNESRPLTKREREVVEWIAAGKRNGEIGKILGCSSRTVQKHVQHILEKLHVETRIAVCIWWYERRLDAEKAARPPRPAVPV